MLKNKQISSHYTNVAAKKKKNIEESPTSSNGQRLLSSNNSLSFSITQKDSFAKNVLQTESSQLKKGIFNMEKRKQETKPEHNQSNNILNSEILSLQNKLDRFEERLLNYDNKENQNQSNFQKNQSIHKCKIRKTKEKIRQRSKSTKRKQTSTGKIKSTRLSQEKSFNISSIVDNESKFHRRTSYMEQRSVGSIRSITRSKEKQIKNLKNQVTKYKHSLEKSQTKREKVEKDRDRIKEQIRKYKAFEKKYSIMEENYLKLKIAFQKSQTIRQRQKKLLLQYRNQIKNLKEQANRRS